MTHYSPTPGMVRLDVSTLSGHFQEAVALDMTAHFHTGAGARAAVEAAIEAADLPYAPGEWTFSVQQPHHTNPRPVLLAAEGRPVSTQEGHITALQDLLSSVDLYIGQFVWKQLTREQKELFADSIDTEKINSGDDDGYRVERWWR